MSESIMALSTCLSKVRIKSLGDLSSLDANDVDSTSEVLLPNSQIDLLQLCFNVASDPMIGFTSGWPCDGNLLDIGSQTLKSIDRFGLWLRRWRLRYFTSQA